jgi:hypothetical protein
MKASRGKRPDNEISQQRKGHTTNIKRRKKYKRRPFFNANLKRNNKKRSKKRSFKYCR